MKRTLKIWLLILLTAALLPAAFAEDAGLEAAVGEVALDLGADDPAEAPLIDEADIPEEAEGGLVILYDDIPGETTEADVSEAVNAASDAGAIDISGWKLNEIDPLEYTGQPRTLEYFSLSDGSGKALAEGTDYALSYENNVNAGTATLIVTGKGNYTGAIRKTFEITPCDIATYGDINSIPDQAYTGSEVRPALTVKDDGATLTLNKDYTVAYSNNINVGTATATITGKGNYTGKKSVSFKIVESSKETRAVRITLISGHEPTRTYDGTANCGAYDANKQYHPLLTHEDFKIEGVAPGDTVTVDDSYLRVMKFDSKNVGNRTVSLNLASHLVVTSSQYTYVVSPDSVTTIPGTISRKPLYVTPNPTEQSAVYGSVFSIRASVTGLLMGDSISGKLGPDTNAGVGRYQITAGTLATNPDNYAINMAEGYLNITPKSINDTDIELSPIADAMYTGSPITQDVTLKCGTRTLVQNVDYKVTYANNIEAGEATITINGIGNYTGTQTGSFQIIKPATPETSIAIIPEHQNAISVGDTLHVFGVVYGDTSEVSTQNWQWASGNKSVATVKRQQNGALVTAKAPGTATIKARTPDKKYIASYTVTVVAKPSATGIAISSGGVSAIGVKAKLQLTAELSPSGASTPKLKWQTSNSGIATVSSKGLVTGKKAGKVKIRVRTNTGLSDIIQLEVRDDLTIKKLRLTAAGSRTIPLNGKLQLNAEWRPASGVCMLKWKSSDPEVASVNSKGVVTGRKEGIATIRVRTDSGLIASLKVRVLDEHTPTGIAINPSGSATLGVNKTLQIKKKVKAIGTPRTTLTWKSSNTKVATVNSEGLVTGKKPGTATITVTTHNNLSASVKITVK